jgi:hypothetical protein
MCRYFIQWQHWCSQSIFVRVSADQVAIETLFALWSLKFDAVNRDLWTELSWAEDPANSLLFGTCIGHWITGNTSISYVERTIKNEIVALFLEIEPRRIDCESCLPPWHPPVGRRQSFGFVVLQSRLVPTRFVFEIQKRRRRLTRSPRRRDKASFTVKKDKKEYSAFF